MNDGTKQNNNEKPARQSVVVNNVAWGSPCKNIQQHPKMHWGSPVTTHDKPGSWGNTYATSTKSTHKVIQGNVKNRECNVVYDETKRSSKHQIVKKIGSYENYKPSYKKEDLNRCKGVAIAATIPLGIKINDRNSSNGKKLWLMIMLVITYQSELNLCWQRRMVL